MGRLYAGSVPRMMVNTATPPSADYDVEAVLEYDTVPSYPSRSIVFRANLTTTEYYYFQWSRSADSNAGSFLLYYRSASNVYTQLGTTVPAATANISAGQSATMKVSIRGNIITCYVNWTQVPQVTDTGGPGGGARINSAGLVGVVAEGGNGAASTGTDFASIKATSA